MSNIYTVNVFLLKRLKFETDPCMLSFSDAEAIDSIFLKLIYFFFTNQYFLIQYPQLEVKSIERWLKTCVSPASLTLLKLLLFTSLYHSMSLLIQFSLRGI